MSHRPTRSAHVGRVLLVLLAATVLTAACGGSEDDAAGTTSATSPSGSGGTTSVGPARAGSAGEIGGGNTIVSDTLELGRVYSFEMPDGEVTRRFDFAPPPVPSGTSFAAVETAEIVEVSYE